MKEPRTYDVILRITADFSGEGYNDPSWWKWHTLLDLAADETVEVTECEEVK